MEKIEKQIRQSELLAAKVFDSLSEEQKTALQLWEEDATNRENQEKILNLQSFDNWSKGMDQLDVSEQWVYFLNRMDETKDTGRLIKMKFFKRIVSVAAALVLGFFIYHLTYQNLDSSKNYQSVAQANILPGKPQAQLFLSNGKVVNLEDSKASVIVESNTSAENSKGVLKYGQQQNENDVQPIVNTLKIPNGGEYKLVLPDGTKVWLNSDTELSYSVPFIGNQRKVRLKGEAYFEVTHNKYKPFIVSTDNQDIEVLGTQFNVSSYSEDLNDVTTLVEGKVKVGHLRAKPSEHEEFLLPNDQLVFNKKSSDLLKQKVDTYIFTSWKDGRFVFKNEPLGSLLAKLGRWYDVEIFIKDESVKNIRFTGDLPRHINMASILKIIEAEMSVDIKIENNKKIYVYNKK